MASTSASSTAKSARPEWFDNILYPFRPEVRHPYLDNLSHEQRDPNNWGQKTTDLMTEQRKKWERSKSQIWLRIERIGLDEVRFGDLASACWNYGFAKVSRSLHVEAKTSEIEKETRRSATQLAKEARKVARTIESLQTAHRVRSKTDNGATVTLEDGSVWEIYSPDRTKSALWLEKSNVKVCTNASPPIEEYKYVLVNMDDDSKASAKDLSLSDASLEDDSKEVRNLRNFLWEALHHVSSDGSVQLRFPVLTRDLREFADAVDQCAKSGVDANCRRETQAEICRMITDDALLGAVAARGQPIGIRGIGEHLLYGKRTHWEVAALMINLFHPTLSVSGDDILRDYKVAKERRDSSLAELP